MLICDDREHLVLRHEIEFTEITKSVMRIETGDYNVLHPNGNIIATIERKQHELEND